MEKILVPVDFSPVSRIAGEYASYIAKVIQAEVHLMHAYLEIPVSSEPYMTEVLAGKQAQIGYEDLLNKETAFLKDKYLVEIHGHALAGFKRSTINDVAAEINPDLIVMGAGNTALAAIRKSKVPVLVIPENAPFIPLKHIVLAVDFHEISHPSCFDVLSQIVDKFDAMLNVVHVKPKGKDEKLADSGKLELAALLSDVTYWYQSVEADDVNEGIQLFIQNHPADLLVIVAHRHNIFERIFGDVHTPDITNETNLPLLVLEDK